jgi:hypothetical protein
MAEVAGSIMLCNCGPHTNVLSFGMEQLLRCSLSASCQMKLKITGLACSASTGVLALFSLVES